MYFTQVYNVLKDVQSSDPKQYDDEIVVKTMHVVRAAVSAPRISLRPRHMRRAPFVNVSAD